MAKHPLPSPNNLSLYWDFMSNQNFGGAKAFEGPTENSK